jgi:hypothetical protein
MRSAISRDQILSRMHPHSIKQVCFRCRAAFLQHAHCPKQACTYHLTMCLECDDLPTVWRVLSEHVADCRSRAPVRAVA